MRFIEQSSIVVTYDLINIISLWVTNFYGVPIEDFTKWVVIIEVSIQKVSEVLTIFLSSHFPPLSFFPFCFFFVFVFFILSLFVFFLSFYTYVW